MPVAPVFTEVFAPLVKLHSKLVGKPHLRYLFVPHPVSRVPAAGCREFILGNDPVTGRPVIDEVVAALTAPLSAEDRVTKQEERPVPRLIGPDTGENLNRYFMENRMTDFLPIVLPTEERVAAMLRGTGHPADEVVGELRSGYEAGTFTVEKVAANAVMAGALPEYLPVILAMAASGVAAIATSTQSFGRMIVVNGPVRKEIGMNCGTGALSPFNRANSVLGRVATLLSMNLGAGGIPDLTYWGSQGNNCNYNHGTFAENEEGLPRGWKPLHVQHGFEPGESAVSFFHGYSFWHWKNTWEEEKHKAIQRLAGWNLPSGAYASGYTLLLDPIVAEDLVREGFPTKESLAEYIYDNTMLPFEEFWQYHLVEGWTLPAALKGVEPFATWLKQPKNALTHRYRSPEEINTVVVGGRTNDFWQGGDWRHMVTLSVDEWR